MRDQPGIDDGSTAGEDLQVLDNVLRATGASDVSRRGLLRSAAVGTAAVGALTVPGLAPARPASRRARSCRRSRPPRASASRSSPRR